MELPKRKFGQLSSLGECPICLEKKLDNRVLVPCGHSVCFDCLGKLISIQTPHRCPECKQEFEIHDQPSKFVKDYRKNSLVEIFTTETNEIHSKKCQECEIKDSVIFCEICRLSLCSQDDELVHQAKSLKTHQRVPIDSSKIVQGGTDQEKNTLTKALLKLHVLHEAKSRELSSFLKIRSGNLDKVHDIFDNLIQSINSIRGKVLDELTTSNKDPSLLHYQKHLSEQMESITTLLNFIKSTPDSLWKSVKTGVADAVDQ
jgi:hypothetical protein